MQPPLAVYYVHTAPTRSNSGLQTLVAQYVNLSSKRPEQLTVADVSALRARKSSKFKARLLASRVSTNSLTKAIVQNRAFWATVASVYESSVIAANSSLQPRQQHYQAVYPKETFTSKVLLIIPAPWMSANEKAAPEKLSNYLRSPQSQSFASDLGLKPETSAVAFLTFTPEYRIQAQVSYDSIATTPA